MTDETLLEFLYLTPVGIVRFRPDGDIDMANPMAAALLMPLAADADMSNIYRVLSSLLPDLPHRVASFPGDCGQIVEPTRLAVPGTPVVLTVGINKINPRTLMAVIQDVTHAAEQEARIHEAEQAREDSMRLAATLAFSERIIADAPVAIYLYRSDGQCILGNAAAARLRGCHIPDLLEKNFRTLPTWGQSALLDAAIAVLDDGLTRDCEVHFVSSFGKEVWAKCHLVSIEMNGIRHLLLVADDLAERKATELALRAAKEAAETAAGAKANFLATMSHEIRTPINAVIGLADLLLGTGLTEQQRRWVDSLQASSDHLLGLVDDILDFSRLEAAKMQFDRVLFDPASVAREAFHMLEARAHAKKLGCNLVLPDPPLPLLLGDPVRLRQILLNLLGNAIKFTETGSVTLGIEAVSATADQIGFDCFVRDTGIGIPQDAQARLFQEFTQMDGSIARRFGGSGLGLAICQRLATGMGGSVAVESRSGAGSCFRLHMSLPVAPTAAAETAVAAPITVIAGSALRVLLAEDDPTNQMLTTAMLHELGHSVDLARNGREALALTAGCDAVYDIILMDMMMPEMDGLAAIRSIRDLDGPVSATRIIALTANALPEDERRCRAAGADDFVTKPLRLRTLEAKLGRVAAPVPKAVDPHPARQMIAELGEATYAEIRDLFLAELTQRIDLLESLDPGNERGAVRREAHTLKSSAAAFGLTAVVAAAAEVEAGALDDTPAATAERIARLTPLAAAAPAALAAEVAAVAAPGGADKRRI